MKTYKDVKVCCYAMCADEPEAFIDRWLDSMSGADVITVLVTKENNPNYTYFLSKKNDIRFKDKLIVEEKTIKPWRFDVARNESMKLIPEDVDVLICTDIDEILIPEFWDDLRKIVFDHPNFERIFYQYAWRHDSETGEPNWWFWYDKITQAKGWKWEYPVHEALTCDKAFNYQGCYYMDASKIYLHHYPDTSKSRGSYLGLLEKRAEEYPEDLYGLFYLQREYSFVNRYEDAITVANKLYIRLLRTQDDMEQLPSVCSSLGQYYRILRIDHLAEFWFKQGLQHDMSCRELWIRLAQLYAHTGQVDKGWETLKNAEKYSVEIHDWRFQDWCWRAWKLNQIKADLYCWANDYDNALKHFQLAFDDIKTTDDRKAAECQSLYSDYNWLQERI